VLPALTSASTPESFAEEQYNGVNAFVLVDKSGAQHAVRFFMSPQRVPAIR
jgi:catalase